MKFITSVFSIVLFLGINNYSSSQDTNIATHEVQILIEEIAALTLRSEVGTSIQLTAKAPEEAGNPLDLSEGINTDIWINYTSVIGSQNNPARDLTVEISTGLVPDGLQLAVEAYPYSGGGKGNFGTPVGKIFLNQNPQSIIEEIKSAHTGDGPNNGHQLKYSLEMNDLDQFGELDFESNQQNLSILYTLTDN